MIIYFTLLDALLRETWVATMKYTNTCLLTAARFIRLVTAVIDIIACKVLRNAALVAALKFIFCTRSRGRTYTCRRRTN